MQFHTTHRDLNVATEPRLPRSIVVTPFEHLVRFRGSDVRVLPPGRHRVNRKVDRFWRAPAVPRTVIAHGQEILTADGVGVRASVATVATVTDPLITVRAGDWRDQLHLRLQLALREQVAASTLEQVVAARNAFDEPMAVALATVPADLGVEVSGTTVRDLIVPGEARRLLSDVVAARLEGQAALERARAQTASLRALANAGGLVRDNPALFQLRLLQEMGTSTGHTFVVGTDAVTPPA
ncbi:MAG: SPFH domain-containing protein [Actinomycetota bacterium]